MTPVGRSVLTLAAEVRDDLDAIGRLVARVDELAVRIAGAPSPDPHDVMAAAAYIHHTYTAMEAIHERLVERIDGTKPSGDRWHQELLAVVGLEIPGVRAAVLSAATRAQLSRLLRFRHFFRHAYRIDLLWNEVAPLIRDFESTLTAYRSEVEAFVAGLEKSASEAG